MQTLTTGATSVLIDDDTARAIMWFDVQLAQAHRTECVEVEAYDLDDQPVTAQIVLGQGVPLTVVTAHSDLPDPDNAAARQRIRDDTSTIENPPLVAPEPVAPTSEVTDTMV